ncbi:MAG: RNA polymerase sigma factor [Deltaproteobacteria bacterium]|nr:MAG: RNA polymerase sigma factor [Deltaproteobacteria bacterium]
MVAFQQGDHAAFEQLLLRHQKAVTRFVLRFVSDRELARDLVQEVFTRVIDKRASFSRRARFTTWLYTIARNLCIDHHRRMKFRRHASLDAPRGKDGDERTLKERMKIEQPGPDEQADNKRIGERIERAVQNLPPEQREVLLLREQGVAFDEIAGMVGVSINTVKSRMRYALEHLKKALEAEGVMP